MLKLAAIFTLGRVAALHAQGSDPSSAKVDSIFAVMDRTTLPGCAVGAVQSGKFLHRRGYGMAGAIMAMVPQWAASGRRKESGTVRS